jgi:Holliday junction resolvase RusA-like endonuclease
MNVQEIEAVPVDVDPLENGTVTNPFDKKFIVQFNGKEIVFKPKESKDFQLPVALHCAKHMADRLVYQEREEEIIQIATVKMTNTDGKTMEIVDEKIKYEESKKPITNYRKRVFEHMKKLVKTDSKFFKDKDAQEKATGHKAR